MKHTWLILTLALLATGCPKALGPQTPAAAAPVVDTPAVEHDGYASGRTLFGTPLGEARSVVFVADNSGSMTDSIDFMKYELKRCIGRLRPEDTFDVLFMASGPPREMPGKALVPATEKNKQAACDFIDGVVPTGETDPAKAIERAFALKPDAIFLLTDGECDRSVVDLIEGLEAGHKCPVNTYCFLYKSGEPVLKKIAGATGGEYRFVGEGDLWDLIGSEDDDGEIDPFAEVSFIPLP